MTMASTVVTAACLTAGAYFFIRNLRMLMDEGRLRDHLTTRPSGQAWVGKFGLERAVSLNKKLFLPAGCVIALVVFGVGVRALIVMLQGT